VHLSWEGPTHQLKGVSKVYVGRGAQIPLGSVRKLVSEELRGCIKVLRWVG
jgi:hypothetical protein